MAMQGKLVERNGALHVLYQTTFETEPVRRSLYWTVKQTTSNPYGHERPAAGDDVRYNSAGSWVVTNRRAGSVSTGDGTTDAAFVEDAPVPPPTARGKELRWYEGRWQRMSAKGWIDAGEGKAASKPRGRAARLDAEIAEALAGRKG